jgi:hypothetical protein
VRDSCSARSCGSNGANHDVNTLICQKWHQIAPGVHWQTGARVVDSACGSTIAVPGPGLALLWTLQRRRVGTHDTKPTMRGPWGVPYRPWMRVRDDLVTFWAGSTHPKRADRPNSAYKQGPTVRVRSGGRTHPGQLVK